MEDNPNQPLCFNFNHECTQLAVGKRNGYEVFSLENSDVLDSIYKEDTYDDIHILSSVFGGTMILYVLASSPRKLWLYNITNGDSRSLRSYNLSIRGVKMNSIMFCVCLEDFMYVYNSNGSMSEIEQAISDMKKNPQGVFAISRNNDRDLKRCYLAYPGQGSLGEVVINDCFKKERVNSFRAHECALVALEFNSNDNKLATTDKSGIHIKVFSIPQCEPLFQFTRGSMRCAMIYCLAFSLDSMFLACSSNTETVHVFRLVKEPSSPPAEGVMGFLGGAIAAMPGCSYVSEALSDEGRHFAKARLPFSGLRNECVITARDDRLNLYVACGNGVLYIFLLDHAKGGDCKLLREYPLGEQPESVPGTEEAEEQGEIGDFTLPRLEFPPNNFY